MSQTKPTAGADTGAKVVPVILSGGSGTRLWPMSRELYPKQLLPLVSEKSLLQDCLSRVGDPRIFSQPLIICNSNHRFIVAEQCREISILPNSILLEPVGRNTAPAVAVAALKLADADPDSLMLVLPSDQDIREGDKFLQAVTTASAAAKDGALVTFGIEPSRAETGYGYIRQGKALDDTPGCFLVDRFVEKPDREIAEGYIKEGNWFWNGGIFLFSAQVYLDELERLQPDMLVACRDSLKETEQDLDFTRLEETAFAGAPSLSIDYAVMEHTDKAAVVPVDMGWNDVGSWAALWDIADKDSDGNVLLGDVAAHEVKNAYLRSDKPLLAVIGLEDVVIVADDDVVLVAAKEQAQDVREIVTRLKADGRPEPTTHSRVYRPWGFYQSIDTGDRFQVKRITVNPGARLSLQKHHKRAEHWVVVNGTARITRGEETFELKENESTYIPLGVVHRLENQEKVPLNLIEVQSGDYLGEDDIVRLEDSYGRE